MNILNKKHLSALLFTSVMIGLAGCGSSSSTVPRTVVGKFTADDVAKLYIATYDKPLSYSIMNKFMELPTIDDVIAQMNPDTDIYPPSASWDDFVRALYRNVYSREGEDAEVANWVRKLENGVVLRKDMWYEFSRAATGLDKITLDNKLEVSRYYADMHKMGDYSLINVTYDRDTVERAKADIDRLPIEPEPIPEPTQSLTNGEDHISIDNGYDMSGDDIIEGKILNGMDTLQTYDGIDGGTGYNIVRATVINGSAATYKNIDEVQFRFAGENDDSNISLENDYTGIDIVSVEYSNVGGAVTHVGNIDDFRVKRTTQDIKFTDGTAGAINLIVDSVNNASKLVEINFQDSRIGYAKITSSYSGYVFDQSKDDGNDSTEDTVSTVHETDIDVTGANTISYDAGEGSLQTIRVTNDGSLDLTPQPLQALVTLDTASSVAFIKVDVNNTDASTVEKIDGTSGSDYVKIAIGDQYLKSDLRVIADSGDDYVVLTGDSGANIETGAEIDGSRGIDILGLNSDIAVSLTKTKDENSFDNFETLYIVDLLDGNADTKVTDLRYIDEIQNIWLLDTYNNDDDDDDDDDTNSSNDDNDDDNDDNDKDVVINGLENNAKITLTQSHDGQDENDTLVLLGHNTGSGANDTYNIYLDNTFHSLNADVDYGNMEANEVETINFVANDGYMATLDLNATNLGTVNSAGTSLLNLAQDGSDSNPLSSVTKVYGGDGGIHINIKYCTSNQEVVTGLGNDEIFLGDTDGADGSVNTATLGGGQDYITGGRGSDKVDLGADNDVYYSSPSEDYITMGTGRDSYIIVDSLHSRGTHIDEIKDFVPNEDVINMAQIIKDENTSDDTDLCYDKSEKTDGDEGKCYLGEVDTYGSASTAFTGYIGETVLDTDDNEILIDINGNGDLDDNDTVIKVEHVTNLSPNDFIFQ